jgi:hypothetical protein
MREEEEDERKGKTEKQMRKRYVGCEEGLGEISKSNFQNYANYYIKF